MKRAMMIVGILVAALALGSAIGVVLGRAHAAHQADAAPTTLAPAGPTVTDRTTQCSDAVNQAGRQVKELADRAATATAADVATLRADAVTATAAAGDARRRCADLLPECPAIADAYAGWLDEAVARVDSRADGLAGTGPATTLPLGDPPSLTCTVAH